MKSHLPRERPDCSHISLGDYKTQVQFCLSWDSVESTFQQDRKGNQRKDEHGERMGRSQPSQTGACVSPRLVLEPA